MTPDRRMARITLENIDLSEMPRGVDLVADGTDPRDVQLIDCKLTPTRDRRMARVGLYLVLVPLALVALGALIAWSLT